MKAVQMILQQAVADLCETLTVCLGPINTAARLDIPEHTIRYLDSKDVQHAIAVVRYGTKDESEAVREFANAMGKLTPTEAVAQIQKIKRPSRRRGRRVGSTKCPQDDAKIIRDIERRAANGEDPFEVLKQLAPPDTIHTRPGAQYDRLRRMFHRRRRKHRG